MGDEIGRVEGRCSFQLGHPNTGFLFIALQRRMQASMSKTTVADCPQVVFHQDIRQDDFVGADQRSTFKSVTHFYSVASIACPWLDPHHALSSNFVVDSFVPTCSRFSLFSSFLLSRDVA
jgi:hypothetical protein